MQTVRCLTPPAESELDEDTLQAQVNIDIQYEATTQKALMRKISLRILPFMFVIYMVAYLDRINIGFAALTINQALGLSAFAFGLATSIFYVGYVLCEIPSNMAMERVGAKLWLPRIMITWGIASAATVFAIGPYSLYLNRFLVGAAEAGATPGILLFLTYFFPPSYRGRANTTFLMAMPVTAAFGSSLSGLILEMGGYMGVSGWQWLFLLEGIPAIIIGIIAYFYLDNSPAQSTWLTGQEKKLLADLFEKEDPASSAPPVHFGAKAMLTELKKPVVMMFCFSYFCLIVALSALSTWTPLIVKSMHEGQALSTIGYLAAIPSVCAAIGMFCWSLHSDRSRERKWHVVLPMLLGTAGWYTTGVFDDPTVRMIGVICATVGTFSSFGVFWTVPVTLLSKQAKAVGIALIASFGLLGSVVSPTIVGLLRDWSHNFSAGLYYTGTMLLLGAIAIAVTNLNPESVVTEQN